MKGGERKRSEVGRDEEGNKVKNLSFKVEDCEPLLTNTGFSVEKKKKVWLSETH